MSVRKYEFIVSATTSSKNQRVWGGMQFEDNATEFRFKPDASLLSDDSLCRIDFHGVAGWNPSETLSPDSQGFYSRLLPYSMTRFGDEIEVTFVISNAESEVLSYPIRVYFTEVSRSVLAEQKVYENISSMEEAVEADADKVALERQRCEKLLEENAFYYNNIRLLHDNIMGSSLSACELEKVKNEAEELIDEVEARLESGDFKGEKGDKGEDGAPGKDAVIDLAYSPESSNAQSGKAVAEAFALKDFELLCDTTITEDVEWVKWTTADNGEPISNYKDLFVYFVGTFTADGSSIIKCRINGGQYLAWRDVSKSATTKRGFWLLAETVCVTEELDMVEDDNNYNGTSLFKSLYSGSLLEIHGNGFVLQGLSGANQPVYSDLAITYSEYRGNKINDKIYTFELTSSTSIFASGSRFLLFGRKA